MDETKVDGDQQEYLLQPQRGRDAIRHAAILADSKYWYHVELFDNPRLRRLLSTVRAPNLVKVLDTLKDAALLNYYFFFPAHEEALVASCTNVEAKEFGGFAGDWVCMALLLEKDGPGAPFQGVIYRAERTRFLPRPLRHEVRQPTVMTWRSGA